MNRRLVFHVGHSSGFYSELNNMFLALLYCRLSGIDFRLYSADANFRLRKGWRDYFLPFCKESINPVHHYINHRFSVPTGGTRQKLYKAYRWLHPTTLLTAELWDTFRRPEGYGLTARETRERLRKIVEETYRFSPTTEAAVRNLFPSALTEPYIGFHIRRGDKFTEYTPTFSPADYLRRAEQISTTRTGFVSTDDYDIFQTLCADFPHWKLYTTTPPTDHGYFHQDFQKLSQKEKYERHLVMLASVELLSRAEHTFCTFSSNVGMFLGMRMDEERLHGMDFDEWLIW